MPRNTTPPTVLLALSPHDSARALGIAYQRVHYAILSGDLTVYALGAKRRILTSQLEAWVKTWPVVARKSK